MPRIQKFGPYGGALAAKGVWAVPVRPPSANALLSCDSALAATAVGGCMPMRPHRGATHWLNPHEKGAAVEMYFDGLSYRRTAGNMEPIQFFGRETNTATVYRMGVYAWVRD